MCCVKGTSIQRYCINLVEIVDTKNVMKCSAADLINIREVRIITLCLLLFDIGMTVNCRIVSLLPSQR